MSTQNTVTRTVEEENEISRRFAIAQLQAVMDRETAERKKNAAIHILSETLKGMLGNYIEMKRIILITARRDSPNWLGAGMTVEDDIHVIAARAALKAASNA